jgi:hypothetical protein
MASAGRLRRCAVPTLAPGGKRLLVALTRFFVKIEDAGIAPASAAFVVVGAYRRNRRRIIPRQTLVHRPQCNELPIVWLASILLVAFP